MAAPKLPSGIPENPIFSANSEAAPLGRPELISKPDYSGYNFSTLEKLSPGFYNAAKSRALQMSGALNLAMGDYNDWYDQTRLAQTYQSTQFTDIESAKDIYSFLRDTAGQGVVDVFAIGAGALAGAAVGAPWLGAAAPTVGIHGLDTFGMARQEGYDPTLMELAVPTAVKSALDLGLLGMVLNRTGLKSLFRDKVVSAADEIGMVNRIDSLRNELKSSFGDNLRAIAIAEGGIEVGQELVDKSFMNFLKDEKVMQLGDQDFKDLLNAFMGGAAGGTMLGLPTAVAGEMTRDKRTALLEDMENKLSAHRVEMKKLREERARVERDAYEEATTWNQATVEEALVRNEADIALLEKEMQKGISGTSPVLYRPVKDQYGRNVVGEDGQPVWEGIRATDVEKDFFPKTPTSPDGLVTHPEAGNKGMTWRQDAWGEYVPAELWMARLQQQGVDAAGQKLNRANLRQGTHIDYSFNKKRQADLDKLIQAADAEQDPAKKQGILSQQKALRLAMREDEVVFKTVSKMIDTWKNLLGVQDGFIVVESDHPDNYGSHYETMDGIHVLAINLKEFKKDKMRMLKTTAHEFGHAMVATKFLREKAEIQVALRKMYRDYLRDLKGMPTTEFYKKWRSDLREAKYHKNEDFEKTTFVKDAGYWLNFEEFMAEQFARFAFGSTRMREALIQEDGKMGVFFKGLYADVKTMVEAFKKELGVKGVFDTNEFKTWIDLMIMREDRQRLKSIQKDITQGPVKPAEVDVQKDDKVTDGETAVLKSTLPTKFRQIMRMDVTIRNGIKHMRVMPTPETRPSGLGANPHIPSLFYVVSETVDKTQPYGRTWSVAVDCASGMPNASLRALMRLNRAYTDPNALRVDLEKLNGVIIRNYYANNKARTDMLRDFYRDIIKQYPDAELVWRNFPVGQSWAKSIGEPSVYKEKSPKTKSKPKTKPAPGALVQTAEDVKQHKIFSRVAKVLFADPNVSIQIDDSLADHESLTTVMMEGRTFRAYFQIPKVMSETEGIYGTITFNRQSDPYSLDTLEIEDEDVWNELWSGSDGAALRAWLVDPQNPGVASANPPTLQPMEGMPAMAIVPPQSEPVQMPENADPSTPIPSQPQSEPIGVSKMVKALTDAGIPKDGTHRLKEILGVQLRGWQVLKWVMTPKQVAERYAVEPFRKYMKEVEAFHNTKMNIISDADLLAQKWRALPKEKAQALSEFLFSVSIWSDENGKRADGEQIIKWAAGIETLLGKKFSLDDETLKMYFDVDNSFQSVLKFMEESLVHEAARTFIKDPIRAREFVDVYLQAATKEARIQAIELYTGKSVIDYMLDPTDEHPLYSRLTEIQSQFEQLRNRNYFPRSRFGRYVLEMYPKKDDTEFEGKVYSKTKVAARWQYESKSDRQKGLQILMQEYGDRFDFREDVLSEVTYSFIGMPQALIERMKNDLTLDLTKDQREAMDKVSIDLSPGRSFLRHLNKRKGIKGYSDDAMRTYASYMVHAANHLARVRHGQILLSHIEELRTVGTVIRNGAGEVEDIYRNVNRDAITELTNFASDHFKYIMNPSNDWAKLREIGFLWYLGFNVKSAAVNLTQVPMVAYPYLAARFGDKNAIRGLAKSMSDTVAELRGKEVVSIEEHEVLQRAMKEGITDQSMVTELAGLSEGTVLARIMPSEATDRALKKVNHAASFLFRHAEMFNRKVVFLAAYRMAVEKGLEGDMAYDAAKEAVQQTMFEYSRWNRPKFMRGKASVIFLFWMYVQQMSYLATGMAGTPEARGTAVRIWAMLLVTAGMLGLPFMENIWDILDFAGTKAKEALGMKNPKVELREMVREALIDTWVDPDILLHGFGKYYGLGPLHLLDMFGVPVPNVDISGSVSMGRGIPWFNDVWVPGAGPESTVGKLALNVAGPVAGIGYNLARFVGEEDPQKLKHLEKIMPIALKNLSKATRGAIEGVETLPGGAKFYDWDLDTWEGRMSIVAQGLGFSPSELTKRYEKYGAMQETKIYWAARRKVLMEEYAYAKLAKDREGIADAMAAIKRHNAMTATKSLRPLRITSDDLSRSVDQRAQARKNKEQLTTSEKIYRPEMQRVERLYRE